MEEKVRSFFEQNELAKKAASSIKEGREIELVLESNNSTETFVFSRKNKQNSIEKASAKSPDFIFHIPASSMDAICEQDFESIPQAGIFIFKKMLSQDKSEKITFQVKAGLLSLVTGGYLGVLSSGGTEAMKFLASQGLGSIGKIKEKLTQMRG
ncbi:MAG: hypothetical protein AB7F43_09685 [Bacteriovoracia bacterium]